MVLFGALSQVFLSLAGLLITTWITPTSAVPASTSDRLWEEIAGVKIIMTDIKGQLDKFNTLYLNKLEQRMVSMAASLASLDSNINNLQERAHVWDTFQHHVVAWNEQINTLDKKVEIINKGQEKVLTLDRKIESISNIEYKVERIIGKLDATDTAIQSVSKLLENQNRDPLLSEFTSRGVLSTLRIMERKLDRILTTMSTPKKNMSVNHYRRNSTLSDETKGKLLIRCSTPPIVEELLHDVSSKVDVIFDRFSNSEKNALELLDDEEDYVTNEDAAQELRVESSDEKLLHKVWRKLTGPYKKTAKVIESLDGLLQVIDNTTLSILENTSRFSEQLIIGCQMSTKDIIAFAENSDAFLRRMEMIATTMDAKEQHLINLIDSWFREQSTHILAHIKMYLNSVPQGSSIRSQASSITPVYGVELDYESSATTVTNTASTVPDEASTVEDLPAHTDSVLQDCSVLSRGYPSGVYQLRNTRTFNPLGRSFYSRYCDMQTAGGGWTVIQRRGYYGDPMLNFSLSWNEYKHGFGTLQREFWFGNEFIHVLTLETDMVLRVELEDFSGNFAWAEYSTFKVGSEHDNYRLTIYGYSGNASDSLSAHHNALFSTYDKDNDDAPPCCPCAPAYGGGWWFYSCFEANLNGIYYSDPKNNDYFRGIIWEHWLGNYSLKKTQMLLRPKKYSTTQSTDESTPPPITPEVPEDP